MAGLLGDDPGPVERAGFLFVPGFGLLRGPVQQRLARLAVAAGEGGIGRPAQQLERHGLVVPVEQLDRLLAEPERLSRRATAQRGDRARRAGGGDGRVIGEQGEPGQLQIQRQATARMGRRPAPGRQQRPRADGGQSGLLTWAERSSRPAASGLATTARRPGRAGPDRGPAAPGPAAAPPTPPPDRRAHRSPVRGPA